MRLTQLLAIAFCLLLFSSLTKAQTNTDLGEIHGNFQADVQYYRIDTLIGAPIVPEKVLSNGFMNLVYTRGAFNAGVRYESYLNVMQGFDPRFRGTGIQFRYATYTIEGLEVTAGNYYEQFGSGLILRAYEERGLGFDNVFDGVRVRYAPAKGIYLKGMIGRQRSFFTQGPGIVRGLDGEININEAFPALEEMKTQFIFGSSFVSRFQRDEDPFFNLPENVGAHEYRINVIAGKWNILAEYAYKINDPNAVNGLIYRPGQALLLTTTYSKKGLGLILSAKRLDNMDFRSDRTATGNNLNINFLPALTRQHTYNLPATIYPYATQPNGEMGFQGELNYKIKKGTALGGKYGTDITINLAGANGIDRQPTDNDTLGYTSDFFKIGREVYFRDYHIEVFKRFSKKVKGTFMYLYWVYNKDVVQGLTGFGTIYAHMGVVDLTYKFTEQKALRGEVQILTTQQDDGSWAMALLEYTVAPHWFVALINQYNYGNPVEEKRLHYPIASLGYTNKANRIMLMVGRQREGIFCVGGVCRNMPASNGVTLSITSSF
ncbi:MAG: DUF6029 family protein [Flavobacteriales bacterium]